MNNETLKKAALGALVFFLLVPVLPGIIKKLNPPPLSFQRVENGLKAAGMSVDQVTPVDPPQIEAIAQEIMYVSGATVTVYKYDNEGHIVTQMAYQKPDSGSAMVESMGIAQALGARVSHQVPTVITRNGMFMLVVSGEDKALNSRIAKVFEGL